MLDDQRAKANPGPSCNLLPHHWVYAVQLPFFATIKKPSAISSWRLLDVKLPPASGCSHPAEAIVAVNPRGMDTLQLVSLPHHRGKRAHLPVFSNCRALSVTWFSPYGKRRVCVPAPLPGKFLRPLSGAIPSVLQLERAIPAILRTAGNPVFKARLRIEFHRIKWFPERVYHKE